MRIVRHFIAVLGEVSDGMIQHWRVLLVHVDEKALHRGVRLAIQERCWVGGVSVGSCLGCKIVEGDQTHGANDERFVDFFDFHVIKTLQVMLN